MFIAPLAGRLHEATTASRHARYPYGLLGLLLVKMTFNRPRITGDVMTISALPSRGSGSLSDIHSDASRDGHGHDGRLRAVEDRRSFCRRCMRLRRLAEGLRRPWSAPGVDVRMTTEVENSPQTGMPRSPT